MSYFFSPVWQCWSCMTCLSHIITNLTVLVVIFLESPVINCLPGNGVVIHLPGLFEEAEKNSQKGPGELRSVCLGGKS